MTESKNNKISWSIIKMVSGNSKINNRLGLSLFLILFLLSIDHVNANNWKSEMLQSVNKLRNDKGLPLLKLCKPLNQSAQNYAKTMADGNFLSHKGKDGSTPGDRMQSSGYDWKNSKTESNVAENIAAGQSSVNQVVKSWKNSKGHYKNMTDKKFTHVGFGMAKSSSSKYAWYWVQNFGAGAKC